MTLSAELQTNFEAFTADWQAALGSGLNLAPDRKAVLALSYGRLTTLQAWRSYLLEGMLPSGCMSFYAEAQNDALISHVQAACGSWRVALKALRSFIENSLLVLYFKDHSVELRHWEDGRFRLGFSDAIAYLNEHYLFRGMPEGIQGLSVLNQEYGKLSQAVHASSKEFRMTNDGKAVALWSTEIVNLNVWATHERRALQGVNLAMLAMFRDNLQGTSQVALRETVARAIPKNKDPEIKAKYGVRVRR